MKIRNGRNSRQSDIEIVESYWERARQRSGDKFIEYIQLRPETVIGMSKSGKHTIAGQEVKVFDFKPREYDIYILTEGPYIVAANNYEYVCRDLIKKDIIWTVTENAFRKAYQELGE